MVKTENEAAAKTAQGRSFEILQSSYGLKDPLQIKLSILWHHIKALLEAEFPDDKSKATLAKYDRHWKVCEAEEQRIGEGD